MPENNMITMREMTINALRMHADKATLDTIEKRFTTGRIADLLYAHRQIEQHTYQRWQNRDGLHKDERISLSRFIWDSWRAVIDARLAPLMVLTSPLVAHDNE